MATPAIEEVDIDMSIETAEAIADGSARLAVKLGKRPAEDDAEQEDDDGRPTKRKRVSTPAARPPQPTDNTLPGYGIKEPDTFMIKLPGGLVRWLRLPPERPFSTARTKLQTLARIARPASADRHFERLQWRDLSSDERRVTMEQRVKNGYIIAINGYKDDYGICSWDELAKLGAPTDVLTTEYPFHAVGKLQMDHSVTLRELHKLGAEGSLQWGSTSIPLKTTGPLPPLVDFLADDWNAWNLGSSQMVRPPNARPESFSAFNWHHLVQRETFSGLKQDVTGRISATFQRCGHRLLFYCRPSRSFMALKQEEGDALYRMEDYERMGTWFLLVVRPGELIVQPPGPCYALYTPENNIIRTSQFLMYNTLREYERWRRSVARELVWSPEFPAMAVLRTVYRLAIMLQHSRSELEVPRIHFLSMARMVLKPGDYLAPARTEEEKKVQSLFLKLLANMHKGDQAERGGGGGGGRVPEPVLREETADYALAAAVVRRRLVQLGVPEDTL
ncbi:hypothetical protein CALVIDRAFT_539226 [Calocera viscosa TUFC12733]|uniref:JmjC domain-containing protein n=1 Tax=Calocera viscosa (strain TUFC12733) TaxID=1330018 RepID=A0A167K262_CALVF|nr:hypothetical protein CALVIDRAFT_539226 [Calocera viscosa TUFC12733]